MKLYNTLTRKKQEFKPLTAESVKMYSCGPTVYNFAHIGNLRTYIFTDLLRRVLKWNGYKITGVMNITDVGHLLSDADEGEDKMVKASLEQKKSPYEIADFYTKVFLQDLKKLNIEIPEILPKATDHITEMTDFVKALMEKGFAYKTTDGIYFDISKFSDYGKLSRMNFEEQIAGARVDVNEEKRHPADFALWKFASKEHIMQWSSPWGLGYPGWHIECSAMAKKYLGETFDIHSGGVDHIPIHHENEIAQSSALSGKQPANFWIHGEFMLVNNGKMSKKLGNTYTIEQLEERGFKPEVFRYFCLNAHYRKKLNFTFEGLEAAKISYDRLCALLLQHKDGTSDISPIELEKFSKEFEEAINDDLNIPKALGILWIILKLDKSKQVYDLIIKMDKIFGLGLDSIKSSENENKFPKDIEILAKERFDARKNKDFKKSDELRDMLINLGYRIKDTSTGYEIIELNKKV